MPDLALALLRAGHPAAQPQEEIVVAGARPSRTARPFVTRREGLCGDTPTARQFRQPNLVCRAVMGSAAAAPPADTRVAAR